MKVLFDGRILDQGVTTGVQRYGKELLKAFNDSGFFPTVLRPGSGSRTRHHFWEHVTLPRSSGDYDILFCPGNVAPLWKPGKTRIVTTLHSLSYIHFPESYSQGFRMYYNVIVPRAVDISARVITGSESEKFAITSVFPEASGKVEVTQNGIADVFFKRGAENRAGGGKYILYAGSLNPLKNLMGVIEAFLLVVDKIPHKLVVAGGGRSIFNKIPVRRTERIEFIDAVEDDSTLADLYGGASMFVFPSFYEASPLPPTEAMACGCPVLVSKIPAHRERCGDAASYCDPGDPADIAARMLEVLQNEPLRVSLVEKGKKRASEYSWAAAAKKTIKVFEDVMKEAV